MSARLLLNYTFYLGNALTPAISMASKQDLDNWGELGNKGWSFEDLLPYYKKFETYHPASEASGKELGDKYLDKSLRGTSGPIHVRGSKALSLLY